MHDLIALDAQNRLTALELRSFIVEAPAGAGKTELLTQRYLKLLAHVDAPEEIIALTFTNKAAAEMRNRILQSLEAAHINTPVDMPHKQQTRALALAALAQAKLKNWQLLTQPSRLRIYTIDALCSSLAAQMPLLSRLGGQPRVADDAKQHYLEAAKRTLAMVANEDSLDAPVSAVLAFMQNDTQKLAELLSDMLAKREQWLPLTTHQHALSIDEISAQCMHILHACIEEKLAQATQVLPVRIQMLLMPVVRYAASHLEPSHSYHALIDWQEPLEAKAEDLPNWLVLCEFLLTKEGDLRKSGGLNAKTGFPKDDPNKKTHVDTFEQVAAAMTHVAPLQALLSLPLLSAEEVHQNSQTVQAFSKVLQLAAAHLWQVFQSAGEVDFVTIARLAIEALHDEHGSTDLALKLDYKISHLLVDEFQDTNASQKELLENLTAGWQAGDGRTLFCVGDPMQSIYRFRKADVSLFIEAAHSGIGHIALTPLKLLRNNRSQPEIVRWINEHFVHIFPAQDNTLEAAISYREFIATREAMADEGVEMHPLVLQADEESAAANAYEASYVATLIDRERTQYPQQSIAVLVRSRTHLHALVSEIRRNFSHLKFQAVEIESLNERQTVQDALSLTRAMLHRADRVHWLNVLRAPWCGLTLADLHVLCAKYHHATIWQLMQRTDWAENGMSADGVTRLQHVKNIFAHAFIQQGRMPLRRWLESTWLQLGGGSTLISAGDNRDVQAFFDLVEKLAQGYTLDFSQLESAMEKLYAEPDIAGDDKLQFLTIHKSKGLEFDCVILPALNRKPRHHDSPLMLWEAVQEAGHTQLLAAPYTKKNKEAPSIYDYIKALETNRANNETARLLYVAATRSIRKLHLVGTIKRKESGAAAVKDSLLALLWPSLHTQFLSADSVALSNADAPSLAAFSPELMRLAQPHTPAMLMQSHADNPWLQQQVSQHAGMPHTQEAPAPLNIAADKGTLVHIYLEMIAKTGLAQWPASRVDTASQAMCIWLQQQGHAKSISEEAACEVQRMLKITLASEQGQWVLKARPDAQCELAIEAQSTDGVAKKVIDRTFIEDGVRWIIDYKTAAVSDADLADLTTISEQYRAQLESYAALFVHEGLPINKAIFYVAIGQWILLN